MFILQMVKVQVIVRVLQYFSRRVLSKSFYVITQKRNADRVMDLDRCSTSAGQVLVAQLWDSPSFAELI